MSYEPSAAPVRLERQTLLECIRKLDPARKFIRDDTTGVKTPLKKATLDDLIALHTQLQSAAEAKATGTHEGHLHKVDVHGLMMMCTELSGYKAVDKLAKGWATVDAAVDAVDFRSLLASGGATILPVPLPSAVLCPPVTLPTLPSGFMVFPAALSIHTQRALFVNAFRHYAEPPNRRNIDAGLDAPVEHGFWRRFVDAPAHEVDVALKDLMRVTWATIGYHYDWTARRYRPEPGWHAAFPAELKALCETIGASVGQPLVAEGGIVNYYYTPRGFMGGHKDDLEYTFAAPVVSISLGCSAVFLLGGQDKSVEPVPLLLRSGDVMVMGGDSRLCIHGVAKVFEGTSPPELFADDAGASVDGGLSARELAAFQRVASRVRVNINARQVFPVGKSFDSL